MKIKSSEFDRSAPNLKTCPQSPFPEFAFIGRSNVGKSSIINLLTERRELAKVSDTPGKTKLINFFRINGSWNLVDLPGYGYANVSKDQRADFNEAVADFIEQREKLRLVFVLIDSRLPPQAIDLDFLTWLAGTGVAHALIFTKTDKQSATQTKANLAAFTQALTAKGLAVPDVLATSAKNRDGRGDVLGHIAGVLERHNRAKG